MHRQAQSNSKSRNSKKYKKVSCPSCSSKNTIKWGKRKTEYRGKIQRYKCKKCTNTFVVDEGFYRMRNHENKITAAIDLYYKGVSLRKVQEHFQAFYPKNSTHVSVYNWIVKYSMMVANLTDNLPIKCGEEIMSDEMEFHRKSHHEKGMKGVEQNWFVDTFDLETRFMIIGDYMRSRTIENLTRVMKYKYNPRVQHNIVIADEGGFNHPIERLHNTIRERTKIMRGFHGCLASACAIMKGLEINYNFNRKHLALKGRTPAEVAIPQLELGVNKWLDLIRFSANQNIT
jgi:putative transposase